MYRCTGIHFYKQNKSSNLKCVITTSAETNTASWYSNIRLLTHHKLFELFLVKY